MVARKTSKLMAHLVSPDGMKEVRLYASGVVTARVGPAKRIKGYRAWRRVNMVWNPAGEVQTYLARGWKLLSPVRSYRGDKP